MTYTVEVYNLFLLATGAPVATTLAAVAGFGGAAIPLPILVAVFGVRDAIPMLTVSQLIGNGSRLGLNLPGVALQIVGWFSLGLDS